MRLNCIHKAVDACKHTMLYSINSSRHVVPSCCTCTCGKLATTHDLSAPHSASLERNIVHIVLFRFRYRLAGRHGRVMLVICCDIAKGNTHNMILMKLVLMPLIMLTLLYNACLKVGKVDLRMPSWIKAKA